MASTLNRIKGSYPCRSRQIAKSYSNTQENLRMPWSFPGHRFSRGPRIVKQQNDDPSRAMESLVSVWLGFPT